MRRRLALASLALLASGILVAAVPAACGRDDAVDTVNDAAADANDGQTALRRDASDELDADAGSIGPSAKELFFDDTLWQRVPPTSCLEAVGARPRFPKRVWTSCGPGCRSSAGWLPFAGKWRANYVTSAGAWFGGDTYLLMDIKGEAGVGDFAHLARLSDDETLAAVLQRWPDKDCYLPYWGAAAPTLFAMEPLGQTDMVRYGRAPLEVGKPIAWHDTNLASLGDGERFIFDDGYGFGAAGGPLLASAPAATAHVNLGGTGTHVHGMGGQLVWGGPPSSVIRSYTSSTSAIDLITLPADRTVANIRLSADRIVWVSGVNMGEYLASVTWQWSPRASTDGGVDVHDGPSLALRGGFVDLQVGGDWAATIGCSAPNDDTACKVHVWHITTGETWTIPHRKGARFNRVLAISPTELVLGETGFGITDVFDIQTLVRIDLASVPTIVATWGP